MQKLITLVISSLLVVGAFGCQADPKTSSESSSTSNDGVSVPVKETSQTTNTTIKETPEQIQKPPIIATGEMATDTIANGLGDTPTNTPAAPAKTSAKHLDKTTVKSPGKTSSKVTEATNGIKTNDLKSLAYNKLQEKLPDSNLEVTEAGGTVMVTGTVLAPTDIPKIAPIVKQLPGVKSIQVAVRVTNQKNPQSDNN